eukprot:COSAG01_NODE_5656_length_4115_cov_3.312749_4_plen_130_part_00
MDVASNWWLLLLSIMSISPASTTTHNAQHTAAGTGGEGCYAHCTHQLQREPLPRQVPAAATAPRRPRPRLTTGCCTRPPPGWIEGARSAASGVCPAVSGCVSLLSTVAPWLLLCSTSSVAAACSSSSDG